MTDAATHPGPELLLGHVTGGLAVPFAVLIGAHLELCAHCRAEAARLEAIGGDLLAELPPAGSPDGGLAATLARLDEPAAPLPAPLPAERDAPTLARLPAALRRYVRQPLHALPWCAVTKGLSVVEFSDLRRHCVRAQLLSSRPGQALPHHRHSGTELTLVLSGGLSVEGAHFGRGDVMGAEPGEVHRPVTEPGEDCLSFAVADGPLRFTRPLQRLWQLITRYR